MQGNVFYTLAIKKLFQSPPAFGMTLLMTFKMREEGFYWGHWKYLYACDGNLLSVMKFYWEVH